MTDAPLYRLTARRVPWPDPRQQPNRAGLSLRWTVHTADGAQLCGPTEYPLADGSFALSLRGVGDEALVTFSHDGAAHDSFLPMPLRIPAAAGRARSERRSAVAALRQHAPLAAVCAPPTYAVGSGPVLPMVEGWP